MLDRVVDAALRLGGWLIAVVMPAWIWVGLFVILAIVIAEAV
jgi:hypothetical protein